MFCTNEETDNDRVVGKESKKKKTCLVSAEEPLAVKDSGCEKVFTVCGFEKKLR